MNEIIDVVNTLGLKRRSKDFIIETFEKEVERLKFLIKDDEFKDALEHQVIVVSLVSAFDRLIFSNNVVKDERLSILLVDDVSIDIFKRRLSEIDQILQDKGL